MMINTRPTGTEPRQQLELAFAETPPMPPPMPPFGRLARARWWFDQMHRVVDAAFDWRTLPPARPEQGRLDLTPARG